MLFVTFIINFCRRYYIILQKNKGFLFSFMFKKVIMENEINEAYISNLSTYMHLLFINEILEEIKKLKAFIDKLKINGYAERNKINTLKRAMDAINKLSKLYFSKSAI